MQEEAYKKAGACKLVQANLLLPVNLHFSERTTQDQRGAPSETQDALERANAANDSKATCRIQLAGQKHPGNQLKWQL